jgi:hypothetical protein
MSTQPERQSTKPHTPGPWRATVDLFRPPKVFVHAPDSFAVCRVMTAHYHAEVARANAHLIAAAPEMYKALCLAEAVYRKNVVVQGEPSSVLDALQAAIAKAEGR